MDDLTVYVLPQEGAWAVRLGPGASELYPDRIAAMAAARRTCRYKWEYEGQPCRLRACGRDGRWTAHERYGEPWL
jgi:hypothetical protein